MYRVKDEGYFNTVKYIFHVCYYSFSNFFIDMVLDLKYSRRFLRGNDKSKYKHLGANDVYHTKYSAMPLIFKNITITPDDILVDVGCGKGRIINYWLDQKYTNKIVGLELDPDLAMQTAAQFARWKNVTIISGDAVSNLPSDGTIFYFYNPFSEEKVKQFEEALSVMFKNKLVKIIYYNPKSIHVFRNSRWEINYISFENDLGVRRWGRINKYHDLAIITHRT